MFYTYIVANRRNGTIYIGMTDDLACRMHEHKTKARPGFAADYSCDRRVWYEAPETRDTAFTRERQLKEWRRKRKLVLIERQSDLERSIRNAKRLTPPPYDLGPDFRRDERAFGWSWGRSGSASRGCCGSTTPRPSHVSSKAQLQVPSWVEGGR